MSRQNQPVDNYKIRKLAEEAILKDKINFEKQFNALSTGEVAELVHELQVHQIELQMQNDELRKAHAALDASRTRYFELYDLAPVGYCTLDKKGVIREANFTAATLLETPRIALENQSFSRFIDKDYQDKWYLLQKRLLEAESPLSGAVGHHEIVELKMINKNGGCFWVRLEAKIAIEGEGVVVQRVTLSDISALKLAEAKNLRLERENQQHQKLESLGSLAAGIAHEFNNLLSGIFGNIELAQTKIKADPASGFLNAAMAALNKARALTQQLLTFSKGGAPVLLTGNLFPFVEETVQQTLAGSKISCKVKLNSDLWPCNFDRHQLGQAIEAIITNAWQSMSQGGVITTSARNTLLKKNELGSLPAGDYIHIEFADTGSGIPAELLPRIYDPFFTTKTKGYGMGLATAYSIIKRHGGHLEVESREGRGTSVHIYLPAFKGLEPDSARGKVVSGNGSGTVVIMDDDEMVRNVMVQMLESLGYHAISLINGQEAVDFVHAQRKAQIKITAMIFDLTIPGGMGGKEAVAQIRQFDTQLPIFVSSGYADDPAMANPAHYGFTGSIPKPCRMAEISDILNKLAKT